MLVPILFLAACSVVLFVPKKWTEKFQGPAHDFVNSPIFQAIIAILAFLFLLAVIAGALSSHGSGPDSQ